MSKEIEIDDVPLTFGKYKGKSPQEVSEDDPSYVVWMYENVKPTPCSKELYVACQEDDTYDEELESDLIDVLGFSLDD